MTISWQDYYFRIQLSHSSGEGDSWDTAISLKTIADYFANNPIGTLYMPRGNNELCDEATYWSVESGDADPPTYDTTDYASIPDAGTNGSVSFTKNGPEDFVALWNGNHDWDGGANPRYGENTYHYLRCDYAEKIELWVKVSNPDIKLDKIKCTSYYSSSRPEMYGTEFTNNGEGWSFEADTWTKIEIDIRKDPHIRLHERQWWDRISTWRLYFSGGDSGDTVKIDGLRCVNTNPNPVEVYPNYFRVPVTIFSSDSSLYFWMKNCFVRPTMLGGYFLYFYYGHYKIGEIGSNGEVYDPVVIYHDNEDRDGHSGALHFYKPAEIYVYGLTLFSAYAKGAYLKIQNPTGESEVKYVNIYNHTDNWLINVKNVDNIETHNGRYCLRDSHPPESGGEWRNLFLQKAVSFRWWTTHGYTYTFRNAELRGVPEIRIGYSGGEHIINLVDSSFEGINKVVFYCAGCPAGTPNRLNLQASFKLKVIDMNNNPIQGANVVLKDKDGNVVFNLTTDENGEIPPQDVTYERYEWIADGVSNAKTRTWGSPQATFNPFTIRISKKGFQTYEKKFTLDKKVDWIIRLRHSDVNVDQEVLL